VDTGGNWRYLGPDGEGGKAVSGISMEQSTEGMLISTMKDTQFFLIHILKKAKGV
jgi:hypothetical protein